MHIQKHRDKLTFDFKCSHEAFDVVKFVNDSEDVMQFVVTDNGPCPREHHFLEYSNYKSLDHVNSLRLRSDELKKHHTGTHTVFSGCSQSFGLGINNYSDLWPKILESNIHDSSGFFNLSQPGASASDIVMDIFLYSNIYSMPDQIIVLFPDYTREVVSFGAKGSELSKNEKDIIKYFQIQSFMNAALMLEFFCKSNNIKLKYSTWHWDTNNEIAKYKTSNYVNIFDLPDREIEVWSKDLQPDKHWSEVQNKKFASILLEETKDWNIK